jgi:hypothetical protein
MIDANVYDAVVADPKLAEAIEACQARSLITVCSTGRKALCDADVLVSDDTNFRRAFIRLSERNAAMSTAALRDYLCVLLSR